MEATGVETKGRNQSVGRQAKREQECADKM